MRKNGYIIDDDVLAHISLLPYKPEFPNGAYFIDKEHYGVETTENKIVSFYPNAPVGPNCNHEVASVGELSEL